MNNNILILKNHVWHMVKLKCFVLHLILLKMPPSFHSSHSVVQRHVLRRSTLRVCDVWCEGFAPHIASYCFPIPRCVPLHHRRRDRGQFFHDEESCIIIHHDESLCMTHGEFKILVLHPPESAFVIPWCKGTGGGVSPSYFAVCGAKASHHTPQVLAFRFHGVCFCTTGEEAAVSCAVMRSPALSYIMMKHHA